MDFSRVRKSLSSLGDALERLDVPAPRYTSYPTAVDWTADFGPDDYARALEAAGADEASPLSVYVHLPFCRQRCAFCGCNVVVAKDRSVADRYITHLSMEMDLVAQRLGRRRGAAQIHWGGGTPTFLGELQLEWLWAELTSRFVRLPGAEVAIEVDPSTTSRGQLGLLRGLGFNRLSLGVQDVAPEVLAAVSRPRAFADTLETLEAARALGFSGVNVDLIYGLPFQSPDGWRRTLEQVAALRPDRLAVYSFAHVPSALPHQRRLPPAAIPSGRDKLELLVVAQEVLCARGYVPIGMDHFALPSDELAAAARERRLTRGFQGYGVRRASDVVALGTTGISAVRGTYAQNARRLAHYYAAVGAGRLATERGIALTADDLRRRAVIEELMCYGAVDLGPDGAATFARELEALRALEREGLLRLRGSRLELEPLGRLFVRNVAMAFDARAAERACTRPLSRTV